MPNFELRRACRRVAWISLVGSALLTGGCHVAPRSGELPHAAADESPDARSGITSRDILDSAANDEPDVQQLSSSPRGQVSSTNDDRGAAEPQTSYFAGRQRRAIQLVEGWSAEELQADPKEVATPDDPLGAVDAPPPDDDYCPINWRDDLYGIPSTLWNDTLACVSWPSAIALGAAAGGAIAIRENLDGEVRDYTARHRLLWGEGSEVLRQFGEFSYQVPAIFAVYGWSVWKQDEQMHEFSKALISAYTITSVTTVAIKGITDTRRPTDQFESGHYGFPSFHTASTFSIAAVVDEYYGWPVGLPCYVLAGLVGFSRIDQREHDLSDVVFGSVLGFVIGKSVAASHMDNYTGCKIVPYYDPATRALGATFHKQF